MENPLQFDIEHFKNWSEFLRHTRDFFASRGVLEATTPKLVSSSGTEVHIEPFQVDIGHETRYLPTSPEFALKKYLSQGVGSIFEISTCFRDEVRSPTHNVEFSMLEWYRVDWDLQRLKDEVAELVQYIESQLPGVARHRAVRVVSVQELFANLGLQLSPQTSYDSLLEMCHQVGANPSPDDSWDDLFWRIFIDRIEPVFDPAEFTFVSQFPPKLAAYAKISDEGWADRFELYYRGFELANAYNEVTDSAEQSRRWEGEREESSSPVPHDDLLLECMKWHFPKCVGVALGLDRLFMALYGIRSIHELPQHSLRSTP